MLENKDYCDYETRNELIKLGYPAHLYDNTEVDKILGAILLYEAQKWLREEKDIHLAVYDGKGKETNRIWVCNLVIENKAHQLTYDGVVVKTFSSYEEALSEGIKDAVKILKDGIGE